jgi:hypothetical protein
VAEYKLRDIVSHRSHDVISAAMRGDLRSPEAIRAAVERSMPSALPLVKKAAVSAAVSVAKVAATASPDAYLDTHNVVGAAVSSVLSAEDEFGRPSELPPTKDEAEALAEDIWNSRGGW